MTLERTELGSLSEYAIETHGLTKKFGSFTAVDQIDLEVRKGEDLWLPGTERRRKEYYHSHALHITQANLRHRSSCRIQHRQRSK